jgi:Fe-S oxidoreductase/nitrate reductase gamma subunit
MFGDEATTREILGNLPTWLVAMFYVTTALACGTAAVGFWRRTKLHAAGRRSSSGTTRRSGDWKSVVEFLLFHREMRRDPFAGWAHLLTFYGFAVLFVGTCLVFLEHDTPLHFYYGWFYQAASLAIDLGGVAFLAGLGMFAARRLRGVSGSPRILRAWWVAALPALLAAIGATGFLVEAARIAVDMPAFERFSIVGYLLASVLQALGAEGTRAAELHRMAWTLHAVLCVALFVLLPWKFFGHMLYGPVSWSRRRRGPIAALAVQRLGADFPPGAAQWSDFSPRDLLHGDACTTCGRCNEVCPATAAGKPLFPRDVVLAIRERMGVDSRNGSALVADDVLWSCTTCGACNQACPVGIDVYDKIVDLRRGRIEAGAVPVAAEDVFDSIAANYNPYGKPNADRLAWAQGLEVPVAQPGESIELLYWVGCSGAFSPEGQAVARAMVKILNRLGLDYRILGTEERCTGDPARRMGEEGLFRMCAAHNLKQLGERRVKKVLTHCPHCYNTMKNEYAAVRAESLEKSPDAGAQAPPFEVLHHSEFLAAEIDAGRLRGGGPTGESLTFHDPCYLGRGNGRTAEPRAVVNSLGLPILEMPRHGAESFCCGAGGGSMWLDVRGSERIENQRFEEARSTGAAIVATACPFCKTMLDSARQASEGSPGPSVMDLAELVVAAEGL